MRRPAGIFLTLVVLLGCAASVPRRQVVRDALVRRDVGAALAGIDRRAEPEDVLWQMERGVLLRAAGRLRESNEAFFAARARQEELFTRSLSNEAAALAWNDRVRPYRSASFEEPYLYVYPMLNFLELGELPDAVVEARALSLELQARRDAPGDRARDWPFGRLLAGLVFESAREWNDAWVCYTAADSSWAGGDGVIDPALRSWVREARRRSAVSAGLESGPTESDRSHVVVLAEEGFVPARAELRLLVPILRDEANWGDDQVGIWGDRLGERALEMNRAGQTWRAEEVTEFVAVSLPVIPEPSVGRETPPRVVSPRGGEEFLWPAEDLDRAARRDLAEALPGIAVRAAGRALVKWLAARGAERRTGEWGGRIVGWLGLATERADTRSWSTLPERISVRVLTVEPGDVKLEIRGPNGETCTGAFAIDPGGWHFLECRFF